MTAGRDPVIDYAEAVLDKAIVAGPWVRLAAQRHLDDLKRARRRASGLIWDVEECHRVIDLFGAFNLPTGAAFNLEPPQAFMVGSLFGWQNRDGGRRFRTAYIEEGKGNGKALALDTPIPTPAGWRSMGELEVNDVVFDELGRPTRVLAAHEVMTGHDCYRVTFDDGASIVADAEHLWFTEQRAGGTIRGVPKAQWGEWRRGIRTTRDIAATLRHGPAGSANHSIPLARVLELPEADLPIAPYTLGVWLGDGDSDCARVTLATQDVAEITAQLEAEGTAVGPARPQRGACVRIRVGSRDSPGGSLASGLRRLGLLGRKHIPAGYLRASRAQRLALLQGLMDTDGYADRRSGLCELTLTNRELAAGALELARSLGLKATMPESAAMLHGREVSRRWRLAFWPPAELEVFRLRRKLQHQVVRTARRRLSADRRIVAVEPVPSVPVRCIAVESSSRLFLAGEAMVPTHNTPELAGIGIVGLVADGVSNAEIYTAGVTKDQAHYLWRDGDNIVAQSPALRRLIERRVSNLAVLSTGSYMRPVSSEARTLDQKRVHMALIDEIHEHETDEVVDKLQAGTKGDDRALIVEATNSGFNRHSICWRHHDYSTKVLQGILPNDEWFAYIAALDEGDDWMNDPSCWIKANPLLGVTISERYLRGRVQAARDMPASANLIARLNFCIWTDSSAGAIPLETWKHEPGPHAPAIPAGAVVYGGLDLSSTTDIASLALVHEHEDGTTDVEWRFWCPAAAVEMRSRRDHLPYDVWVKEGHLIATPGDVTDYDAILADLTKLADTYTLREVGYVRLNATQFVTAASGITTMVPITQTYTGLSAGTKDWLKRLGGHKVRHGSNPVASWMASNLVVDTSGTEDMKPSLERSTERITGQVAAILAVTRLTAPHDQAEGDPGLLDYYRELADAARVEADEGPAEPAPAAETGEPKPACGMLYRAGRVIEACGREALHQGGHGPL